MKIQKLVIENINSLYGKWEIDFDSESFKQSGIFAITGKTGSGKSTILDAMCLALYGTTPRLNSKGYSGSDAISRGCQECFCELTFLDKDNREWIATYGYEVISKGNKKGQRKDAPFHRLASNKIVEADKTSQVKAMVEEIIGLDFERFCRAVLLAQGSFDAFLNAGKENGEILERITGTDIYSKIALKAKERYKEEVGLYNNIKAQLEGVELLSDEDEQKLAEDIEILKKELAECSESKKKLDILRNQFKELADKTKELEKCVNDETALAEEEKAFAPNRQKLENGKRVLEADKVYIPLKKLLDDQAKDLADLRNKEALLKEQQNKDAENKTARDSKNSEVREYEKAFSALAEIIAKAEQLDIIIETLESAAADAADKRKSEISKALACRTLLAENSRKLEELQTCHAADADYLESHKQDSELTGIQMICLDRLKNFKDKQKGLSENAVRISALRKELETLQKDIEKKKQLLNSAEEELAKLSEAEAEAKQKISDILGKSTIEDLKIQRDKQQKICDLAEICKSLEERRKQLKDGEACPLCGATEHPFAVNNIPEVDKEKKELADLNALIERFHKAEKELQTIFNSCKDGENKKLQCKNILEQAETALNNKKRECENLVQEEEKIKKELEEISMKIDSELAPFGLAWDEKSVSLPAELDARIKAFADHKKSLESFAAEKSKIEAAVLQGKTELKGLCSNSRSIKKEWQSAKQNLAGKVQERRGIFGTKDTKTEKSQAEKKRSLLAAELQKLEQALTESATNCKRTLNDIDVLNKSIQERSLEINNAQAAFDKACRAAGVTEAEFHTFVLPQDEMTELTRQDTGLVKRKELLAETRTACEEKIKNLSEYLADKNKDDIESALQKTEEDIETKNQALGVNTQKQKQNEEAKSKNGELHKKLSEQQNAVTLWEQLDDLIGVKDRFQRFAQGITLEHLLVLANIELEKFSGRYRLLRSTNEDELGIDVADKDQGDEIRSCKTLSGGERFLVSLSLALGLSQMAGEKISVDSLFLDEGFGTLDSETLETALEALSNLRNRGKLVGVISHVSAFAEKIPCIIEVNKSGGGRSTLKGPGVKAL